MGMQTVNPEFTSFHIKSGSTRPDPNFLPLIRLQRGADFFRLIQRDSEAKADFMDLGNGKVGLCHLSTSSYINLL